ncbi:proline iminopeptidase [Karstenula rhodostoma CBS 690.94]|uniref:Proline iminopeptidase n=1 Tax=Karstenula rhodostoma CBS 690.94 TaxID=1392251 RepID=A0A9P4PKQ0_9PLEO|nr:proline iminopeptidase [Karstenula rhodostoma CBS 690.94]
MALKTGYLHDDAFDDSYLEVSDLHKVHYYQYGKEDGKPVIFLHGGPGTGCKKQNTVFFDPKIYRVVLLDQRGTGLSTPRGETRENTTQALVSDIEALRKHVGVEKWHMVFGGSWGSALSLAYAQTHPDKCGSLVIRGVFLGTKEENDRHALSTSMIFPEIYDRFVNYVAPEKRGNIAAAYHELLTSKDPAVAREAAYEWDRPETTFRSVQEEQDDDDVEKALQEKVELMTSAIICTHYMLHESFLGPTQLVDGCEKIQHIPTRIAQGRLDFICPPRAAYEIHKRLPNSELHWLPKAGHTAMEPDTLNKLVDFCDELGQENLHL